ncbi:cephalosporin hydroxylase family protein [Candidatus Babeliales bacterium]|nr:cephalosporin hydroxylase family protein [Candidatus Babeliales bacterium]
MKQQTDLKKLSTDWLIASNSVRYSYNFQWMGIPIIQLPQDIVAMQELIWEVKPDYIVETGIAHGGSVIFYASMLKLVANNGKVIAVDIDIRETNKKAIESHPLFNNVTLLEGSSTDQSIVEKIASYINPEKKVLVCLDSNHTHAHVLEELQLYSPLVTKDSYLVVFDTTIEDVPSELFSNRPWDRKNNPKTAIVEFLKTNNRFVVDRTIDEKLLITANRDGFLKCIAN